MLTISNYSKYRDSDSVLRLFVEMYPNWTESQVKKMIYHEENCCHLETKLAHMNGILIGQANVFRLCKECRIVNLGYHVISEYTQMGIGDALVKSILLGVIDKIDIEYVVVQTTRSNIGAIKLAQKNGFKDYLCVEEISKYSHLLKYKKVHNGICLYRSR